MLRVADLLTAAHAITLSRPAPRAVRAWLCSRLRRSHLSQGRLCRPRIFVDGLIYNRGDSRMVGVDDWGNPTTGEDTVGSMSYYELNIDDIAHPSSIAGIEVYRSSAQVPVQFGGGSIQTQCGVIVIWTKVGRIRRRRR